VTTQPETQLDRIERKLDELLELRDAALKIFLPNIPAPFREAALQIAARAQSRRSG
jgi:hypothetical protein